MSRVEWTGNIQVHHDEDRATIWAHQRATINRIVQDQNNPEGDRR